MAHAKFSPSGAHRWLSCPGSVALEATLPDSGTIHAEEGVAAHLIGSLKLQNEPVELLADPLLERHWSEEMDELTDKYVQTVLDYRGADGTLFIETELDISHITGEHGAHGTADAIILRDDEVTVIDLKYGRGVEVSAVDNPQLKMYALAAYEVAKMMGAAPRMARMVIYQPRVSLKPSEWTCSYDELRAWADDVVRPATVDAAMAQQCGAEKYLHPGEKQCQFCKAKATCPALYRHVSQTVAVDFDDLTTAKEAPVDVLAHSMAQVDLIESWCKAVRAETERRLVAGIQVPGFKIVQGRMGARKWASEEEITDLFKRMRLKVEDMYDLTLISPTQAEKLKKRGTIGERQWAKVEQFITRNEGKPSVAPESDPRPAVDVAGQFSDLTQEK